MTSLLLANDNGMSAFGRYRRVQVEIVEPADELERAGLDEAEELLREEDLGRYPALDLVDRAAVVHVEGDELVVGLRDRIVDLGAVGHPHRYAAAPPRPA